MKLVLFVLVAAVAFTTNIFGGIGEKVLAFGNHREAFSLFLIPVL
jgi:hypothetical protein